LNVQHQDAVKMIVSKAYVLNFVDVIEQLQNRICLLCVSL